VGAGRSAFVDVYGFEKALGDVHSAGGFEAVVEADSGGCAFVCENDWGDELDRCSYITEYV
jgi:hypothetical protein